MLSIHPKLTLDCLERDDNGRLIDFVAHYGEDKQLTARAVYAPAEAPRDRAYWYDALPPAPAALNALLGDFNVEIERDRTDAHSLTRLVQESHMTDPMTAKLAQPPLTFFHRNRNCRNSAIDRVFCTPEAVQLTVSVETVTGHGLSDHSGILHASLSACHSYLRQNQTPTQTQGTWSYCAINGTPSVRLTTSSSCCGPRSTGTQWVRLLLRTSLGL